MAQKERDFTVKDCLEAINCLFINENSAKNIYDNLSVTLGEKRSSYCTVKHWVAGFRTGHLSTADEKSSRRPTQVTIPESVDAIHSKILDDRRISTKKIAETPAISRERVGYISHEILDMRKFSAKCCSEA
jgi:hypothetical protein